MDKHPKDLLPGYALGCLDEEDFRQVESHLRSCNACSDEVRSLSATCTMLAHAIPPVEAPAAIKTELFAHKKRTADNPWLTRLFQWPGPLPVAALAGLVLVLMIGLFNLFLSEQLTNDQINRVHLSGTKQTPQASGTLTITRGQTMARLQVSGLPPLTPDTQYQLWLIRDGIRSNGGVFSVGPEGEAQLTVSADRPLDSFQAFGITIEPYGGSPGPTGPKVLGGKLAS